jgi:hypothetical protein
MSVGKSSFLNSFVFFPSFGPPSQECGYSRPKVVDFFYPPKLVNFPLPDKAAALWSSNVARSLFAVCLKGFRLIFV